MPFNLPGTLVPLHLIISPRLVIPSMIVKGQSSLFRAGFVAADAEYYTQEDIRQLDFYELRRAGYRGAVFDKDNCLVSRGSASDSRRSMLMRGT